MSRRKKPAGATYPNRSDLQAQPPTAATGLPYGEHQALVQAQQAMPIASPAGPAPSPVPADQQALALAQAMPPPSNPLDQPSTRPNEPITAGLPSGPGDNSLAPLNTDTGPDLDVLALGSYLPMLEVLSARPGSSSELRQLVRRVRSNLPPGYDFGNPQNGGVV